MTEVSFEEEQGLPTVAVPQFSRAKGLVGLIIKTGLAKTEAQANMVLIIIAVTAFVATVFVLMSGPRTAAPSAEDQEILNEMMQ